MEVNRSAAEENILDLLPPIKLLFPLLFMLWLLIQPEGAATKLPVLWGVDEESDTTFDDDDCEETRRRNFVVPTSWANPKLFWDESGPPTPTLLFLLSVVSGTTSGHPGREGLVVLDLLSMWAADTSSFSSWLSPLPTSFLALSLTFEIDVPASDTIC